jgi:uncharacterized protein YqeY
MSLLEKIQVDLKDSMKAHDDVRVSTLRMVISAANNARISKGAALDDNEVQAILAKEVKLRNEAITMSKEAGRTTLVERGEQERAVLKDYLPEELSEEILRRMVDETISEVQATSRADMGKVMRVLVSKTRGRADSSILSILVQDRLT